MTEMHTSILRVLRCNGRLTASDIARAVSAPTEAVQAALHKLDDAGQVILRNGFYRASAAALRGQESRNG